ncbi:MAG: hypothetical protein HY581_07745 [Nitrospirae bacterium]|nr:hypothetical protein [Nitrospirota bacterium]
MSKCVYCRQRKGKRACPALGGLICSQCCGEHRMVRIACPSDCVYLDSNSEYQQKRVGDRFAQDRRDFYKELFELGGEKAAGLFNLIEVVTFSYFHNRRDAQDGEVIAAIQTLRRTLSPLHIPAAPAPVFAEHLKKEYEAFTKQQAQQAIDQQTATEVLDRALKFVTGFSGQGLQSNRFLTGLIGYIKTHHPEVAEHLAKQGEEGRIVLPGQFMPSPAEPHVHGPGCGHNHQHRH